MANRRTFVKNAAGAVAGVLLADRSVRRSLLPVLSRAPRQDDGR